MCRIICPENDLYIQKWAEEKYKEIREWTDDVEKIAENTGILIDQIQRIKEHLFYNEHILRNGKDRLRADEEIAAAWDRLYQGDYIKNDIRLLEHALFESVYEKAYGTDDYRTVHAAAKQSGKPWKAPRFKE